MEMQFYSFVLISQENNELRDVLKRYLDGISVNEDVISDDANPLLVINDRMMKSKQTLLMQQQQQQQQQQEGNDDNGNAQNILVVEQLANQLNIVMEAKKNSAGK